MALNLTSQFLLSHPCSPFISPPCNSSHHHHKSMFLLLRNNLEPSFSSSRSFWNNSIISAAVRASISDTRNGVSDEEEEGGGGDNSMLDEELISRASSLKDASEVLQLIADNRSKNGGNEGVVNCEDCCRIINAAFLCYNSDLALSIFAAMRSSAFNQVLKENGGLVARWKWSRPDVNTYTTLVIGLAASLRVSDALKFVEEICQVGLSHGEEVPFGKIIRCPTCTVAVAVAQPQQGIQVRTSR